MRKRGKGKCCLLISNLTTHVSYTHIHSLKKLIFINHTLIPKLKTYILYTDTLHSYSCRNSPPLIHVLMVITHNIKLIALFISNTSVTHFIFLVLISITHISHIHIIHNYTHPSDVYSQAPHISYTHISYFIPSYYSLTPKLITHTSYPHTHHSLILLVIHISHTSNTHIPHPYLSP